VPSRRTDAPWTAVVLLSAAAAGGAGGDGDDDCCCVSGSRVTWVTRRGSSSPEQPRTFFVVWC